MPKIVVTEFDRPFTEGWWRDTRYLRIGWSREVGTVQIATCDVRSGLHEVPPDGSSGDVPGLLVTLGRAGLDEAIRTLQRARAALDGEVG